MAGSDTGHWELGRIQVEGDTADHSWVAVDHRRVAVALVAVVVAD